MQDTKNLILAVALSVLVLVGWQYFFGMPLLEQKKQADIAAMLPAQRQAASATVTPPAGQPAVTVFTSRADALAAGPRIMIDTPKLKGSLALIGGDIDDISFKKQTHFYLHTILI